jgi:hypothetical protein
VGASRAAALTPVGAARARVGAALLAATVANVLGWILPVVDDYRGWQAFRVAFSPVWPFEQFRIDPGPLMALSVASALTNVLFVVLAALLALGRVRSRARARTVLWVAAGATLLDLHWPISMAETRVELENGYFIWVASFALLALAAYLEFLAAADRTH